MIFRSSVIISALLIFPLLTSAQSDGILKNGRSVRYYSQKGQWIRDIEPEESEYIQNCIAKVLNSFGTVKIENYVRSNRYSPEAEDITRNRTDDQNGIPFYLQGTLTYSGQNKPDIHIQLDVNPKDNKIKSTLPVQKFKNEYFPDCWKVENYATTTSSGKKYYGTAYFISINNSSKTPEANEIVSKGTINSKNFLQINHLLIRILAPEKQALEIMTSMNRNKLSDTLKFSEKWP